MKKGEKRNQVTWNSGKVNSIKSDFLKTKNYVRKYILMIVGFIIGLFVWAKKMKKCWSKCTSL